MGGLNNGHLFLTALQAGESEVKVAADLSGEDPLPGVKTTTSLLYPHMEEREREGKLSGLFYKSNNLSCALTLMTL